MDGISADQSRAYRTAYWAHYYASGNDIGTIAYLNMNEVFTTSTLFRQGPVVEIEEALMPQIVTSTATTKLGTLSLAEAMADNRSRKQAIAVVHKGKLVFDYSSYNTQVLGLIIETIEVKS